MSNKMKVALFGGGGESHASGEIEMNYLAEYPVLKRNEIYYAFFRIKGETVYYAEIKQPLIITEF